MCVCVWLGRPARVHPSLSSFSGSEKQGSELDCCSVAQPGGNGHLHLVDRKQHRGILQLQRFLDRLNILKMNGEGFVFVLPRWEECNCFNQIPQIAGTTKQLNCIISASKHVFIPSVDIQSSSTEIFEEVIMLMWFFFVFVFGQIASL